MFSSMKLLVFFLVFIVLGIPNVAVDSATGVDNAVECSNDLSSFLPSPYSHLPNMVCKRLWNSYMLQYSQTEDKVVTVVLSTAYSTGWVGMGFSRDGMMLNASCMVGWITQEGHARIKQYYVEGFTADEIKVDKGELPLTGVPPYVALHAATIYLAFQLKYPTPLKRQPVLLAYSNKYPHHHHLTIPSLQSLINKTIIELERELSQLGKPIATDDGGKLYMIMEICRGFDAIFKEHLDGVRPGGDKVYNVFDNQLPGALKRLQFDKHLSMDNVRKLITQADGYQPHLIAPEQGYRRLVESTLVTIKSPAEAAVDAVHAILKDLIHKSISETTELKQYPSLRVELANAAVESLDRMRNESKKATLQLVDMECSYLTVDFFRKLPQDIEKGGNPTHSIFDRYNDSYLRRIGSNVLTYANMVAGSLRHSIPKSIVYCQVREAKRSLLDHFFADLGKKEGRHLGKMLDEDPAVMQRRVSLAKRLELYRAAQAEIDSVAWAK